ncbi:MAG: RdgB/HAM1 family non-canonical purine NTP pyrophosphatase [Bacteroidia bacterium]|nr:RdgB/HAM1 family non-canonical purine NTP pyrophosphatase [Bacteroidia bacterium]
MGAKWVFATKNPHKLAEVQNLLEGILDIEGLPSDVPEAPEPHADLYGNALAKATFYAQHLGLPVIAEDSGLFVPALGGQPGVQSAHFGGPARLLEAMRDLSDRRAYFTAVVVAYISSRKYFFSTGFWQGEIAETPRGSEGFGYDPVFIPAGRKETVAELGQAWKQHHSHRSRAFRKLVKMLQGISPQE